MPWRVARALAWLRANNWRAPWAWLRFSFRRPEYRILLSTAFFGGVGGVEKRLKTLVESMPESKFHIAAREVRNVGFIPRTANFLVNWRLRPGASFDLYVFFAGGGKPAYLGDRCRFRKSLLETSGADVRDVEGRFDYIAVQTGNFGRYCSQHHKCVLALTDIRATFPVAREPVELPERYFVTVFNPFSNALKGNEVVYQAAERSRLPIVWCFSDRSGWDFDHLPDHPNVVKMKNLSQEALYFVYERALAYVSFSRAEGFGWAIAEAFYLGLPIIAREVGFLTYVNEQAGIHIYRSEDELYALLGRTSFEKPAYDYRLFEEHSYPKVIERILAGQAVALVEAPTASGATSG